MLWLPVLLKSEKRAVEPSECKFYSIIVDQPPEVGRLQPAYHRDTALQSSNHGLAGPLYSSLSSPLSIRPYTRSQTYPERLKQTIPQSHKQSL